MFSQLRYLLAESWRSLLFHRSVILPSLITIFLCALLLIGSFVVLLGAYHMSSIEKSLYSIEVFLPEKVSQDSVESLKKELHQMKWLESVDFVSEEMALEDFQTHFSKEMLALVEGNPLPASFKLTLGESYKSPYYLNTVLIELEQNPSFDVVQSPVAWVERFSSWKFPMIFYPILLSAFLLFSLVLIIGNSVRLSLYSRKDLVENMKYAGGSTFFIVFPFVFESLFQGLLGSITAALLFRFLISTLLQAFPFLSIYWTGFTWVLLCVVFLVTTISVYFSWRTISQFLLKNRSSGF
ncbi:MAG: cell division protein [Fibrobacter sp.]|nr:cell division protein [Fibrobacter sp.]